MKIGWNRPEPRPAPGNKRRRSERQASR